MNHTMISSGNQVIHILYTLVLYNIITFKTNNIPIDDILSIFNWYY